MSGWSIFGLVLLAVFGGIGLAFAVMLGISVWAAKGTTGDG